MCSVVIAGAGPAGVATAARLIQCGVSARDILILDRYRFPREKPCGGGLTGHAAHIMAELDFRLDVAHVASPAARVVFGGFEREVTLGQPVWVIRREDFDASLVDQIRARGIEVAEGEGVERFATDDSGVTVTTSRGRSIRTAVLVGADGAASVVRKHLVAGKKAIPHRLFKMELSVPAQRAGDTAMVYDFSPMARGLRGYLWLFPVAGNRVNVGLMHYPAASERRSGGELVAMLRAELDRYGIELPARGARGWPVWGYHPGHRVADFRVVTVGDAAGIDGLTGEGIAVAMEQAHIAGTDIAAALASGDFAFSGYRRRLRRAVVGRELALDRHLARLLYAGGGQSWQRWLSLVLFDPDVLHMYAARVDGTEILADQKRRLYGALCRHLVKHRGRRQKLRAAMSAPPAAA